MSFGTEELKAKKHRKRRKPIEVPKKFKGNFLATLDGRWKRVRVLQEAFDEIVADTDSEAGSHIKRALIMRFVWLEAVLTAIEGQFIRADEEKAGELLAKWVQALNSMIGLSRQLGLERRARKIDSLETYLRQKDKKHGRTQIANAHADD
jgi:hypothetical protein